MRKPNGYGSIKKLSGNRRRPYVFLISTEGKQKPISYFCTQAEAEIYAAEYNKSILKNPPWASNYIFRIILSLVAVPHR